MKALVLVEGTITPIDISSIDEMEQVVGGGLLYKALHIDDDFNQALQFFVSSIGPIKALPEVNIVNPDGTCHGTFFGPMLVVAVDLATKETVSLSDRQIEWIKYGVDKVFVLEYRKWVHTLEIHKEKTFSMAKV